MQTQPLPVGVLGGMNLADRSADWSQSASWDVNGWFTSEYRDVRRGTRPIMGLRTATGVPPVWSSGGQDTATAGHLDYQGVHAIKTRWGGVRLLVACSVTSNCTISVNGTAAVPVPQSLFEGEIVFLLVDPARQTVGGNALLLPAGDLFDAVLAVGVFKYTTPGTWPSSGRVAADAVVFPRADWQPQFYERRDKIMVFGHPSGAVVMDLDNLREAVPRGFGILNHFEIDGFSMAAGAATASYSYFVGPFPPVSVFPVFSIAWYVPCEGEERDIPVTVPVPTEQESVPQDRVGAGGTTVRWDSRQVYYSEVEQPEAVKVLLSSYLAPSGSRYTAVGQAGQYIGLLMDNRACYIDTATGGAQSITWQSYGTTSPLSVQEIGDSLVFVNSAGIVMSSPEQEQVVSSPFLDGLFQNNARSTLPVPLSETERRLGMPLRVDHAMLPKAVSWHDFARGWYCVALTSLGSTAINDMLVVWDYRANRFSLMHGAVSTGIGRGYAIYDASPLLNGTFYNLPSFAFSSVATFVGADNKTRVFAANQLGVFEMFDEDTDYLRVQWRPENYYGITKTDGRLLTFQAVDIESVRVTPAVGLEDFAQKGAQDIRVTCWRPVFADNGYAQVYVEGERGSLQLIDASDISADGLYRETQQATMEMFVRETRNRKYWGLNGEYFNGNQVWQRDDYICVDAKLHVDNLRWWRVTFYDRRGASVVPAMLLVNAQLGAYVSRAADGR